MERLTDEDVKRIAVAVCDEMQRRSAEFARQAENYQRLFKRDKASPSLNEEAKRIGE